MAALPAPELTFVADGCPDCGRREVALPEPLPALGDDFDWLLRDYDGFRLFMLEELAARFPERRRWTPADMEVVIVETLAVLLDQRSDQLDRVQMEATLATARRPDSVRRLLAMIGYDAVARAEPAAAVPDATGPAGEAAVTRRARLADFLPALRTYLGGYGLAYADLGAPEQAAVLAFARDNRIATPAVLDAVAAYLRAARSAGAPVAATQPPPAETPAARARRLAAAMPEPGLLHGDQLTALAELAAGERATLLGYIAAPPTPADLEADPAGVAATLDMVQAFLEQAPGFVARARAEALERHWSLHPQAMDRARAAGPRAVHTQHRMVTLDDYGTRLAEHPLVSRARARAAWSGSWQSIQVALICAGNIQLDTPWTPAGFTADGFDAEVLAQLQAAIAAFHAERGLPDPDWTAQPRPRTLLRPYLDAYRMAGQEVWLADPSFVGIQIALSVQVAPAYFHSEVRRALPAALGTGLDGFFEPGRLDFGEDLHASDIIETVMALDGVEAVCLNRFKRVGRRWPDRAASGRIAIAPTAVAVCDNDAANPARGWLRLTLSGGRHG